MTTKVIVEAHCPKTHEVLVNINKSGNTTEEYTVQDGDKLTLHVYDDREVVVSEVPK
jgi:hypothetical protein